MALTRGNETVITWDSGANSSKSIAAAGNSTTDAFAFNATTVDASITVNAANDGTEAAGDTLSAYALWTGGNVDGSAGDDYDTAQEATLLGVLDLSNSAYDPARHTWSIPVGAKGFKLYFVNNSAGRAITARALLHEVRS